MAARRSERYVNDMSRRSGYGEKAVSVAGMEEATPRRYLT
jgi:hypothetical protein